MTINATRFKAQCLSILDDVARTGETVTILKRGKPVARLVPPTPAESQYPQHELFGTLTVHGDLLEPATAPEDWDAERGEID